MTGPALFFLFAVVGDAARQKVVEHAAEMSVSNRTEVVGALDLRRVLCPVLAALIKNGDMGHDGDGNVEIADIRDAIDHKLGGSGRLGTFQAHGISTYKKGEKERQITRERCSGWCLTARHVWHSSDVDKKRWFSAFRMNGRQVIEHGISTGTRGGATNMPFNDGCGGIYPCEANFDKFVRSSAEPNGRFYLKNILAIVCKARKFGDRGGEWSFKTLGDIDFLGGEFNLGLVPARDWQMKGAMSAMLFTFGQGSGDNTYMTMEAMESLFLKGDYPSYWSPKDTDDLCLLPGGCEWNAFRRFNLEMDNDDGTRITYKCDQGKDDPWWQGQGCQPHTGESCHAGGTCSGGAICVSRMCICPRASSGRSKCFKNGKCKASSLPQCTYFGKPCEFIPANNPDTEGNP
jgi:hypothetical protein